MEKIPNTSLTHVTTWWEGLVRRLYQDLNTSIWRLSMKITSFILFQFKALTAPKHYLSGDLCLSFEIFIIYDWYFYITYTCGMDLTDDNYFFPEFSNMLFESGEVKIDSKVYHMFRKFYQCYYDIIQNYWTIEWSCWWNSSQMVLFHFPMFSS